MEDEGIVPNTQIQLMKSVWTESRACTLHILEYSVLARISANTDKYQLYAFASISSSSILRPRLYILLNLCF